MKNRLKEEIDNIGQVDQRPEKKKRDLKRVGIVLLIIGCSWRVLSQILSSIFLDEMYTTMDVAFMASLVFVYIGIFVVPILIILGLTLVFVNRNAYKSEIEKKTFESLPKDNKKAVMTQQYVGDKLAKISIIFLGIRVIISILAYLVMVFGSGPWSEGRVYYSLFGYGDILWLIICLTLNIIATIRKCRKTYRLAAWILWGAVAVLTVLILAYHP